MRFAAAIGILAALAAAPARAEGELEAGLAGALRACEAWVLDPASQALSPAAFAAAAGLAGSMHKVERADEAQLPPPPYRAGLHYWRIDSTPTAGYMLIVSDRLPVCHITGGGDADLQPAVAAVLASDDFAARWTAGKSTTTADMVQTPYQNRKEAAFSIVVSRAAKPGGPRDRVQAIATAQMRVSD